MAASSAGGGGGGGQLNSPPANLVWCSLIKFQFDLIEEFKKVNDHFCLSPAADLHCSLFGLSYYGHLHPLTILWVQVSYRVIIRAQAQTLN